MRKYKGLYFAVQVFAILLLVMSKYLDNGIVQVAYCYTAFSAPFLLLAFGEAAFFSDGRWIANAAVFLVEFLISFVFIGAMITGMQWGSDALRGFGTLLLGYCIAAGLSIVERIATRA